MGKRSNEVPNLLSLLICGIGIGILVGLSKSPVLYIILGSIMALAGGITGTLAGLRPDSNKDSHITRHSGQDLTEVEVSKDSSSEELDVKRSSNRSVVNLGKNLSFKASAVPLMMIIVGLVIGAISGIFIREYDLLAPNPERLVEKWQGTGLSNQDIKLRIFEQNYPPARMELNPKSSSENTVNSSSMAPNSNNEQKPKNVVLGEKTPIEETSNPNNESKTPGVKSFIYYYASPSDCDYLRLREGEKLKTGLLILSNSAVTKKVEKCGDDNSCLEQVRREICPK